MTPEISEFSYGFALTNEIVGWAPIAAAPVFPSLIEEGRAGGGYDVKLDMAAVPLYLQFKRSDCMTRRSAREIKQHNLPIEPPFYRFSITQSGKSDQHELLLALDDGLSLVFYAAPRFHQLDEIDAAWQTNSVATRSIFVAPSAIGPLDAQTHCVSFDDANAWLCSDPKSIPFVGSGALVEKLIGRIEADPRPLSERLPEFLRDLEEAEVRARARMFEKESAGPRVSGIGLKLPDSARSIPVRPSRELSEPERLLREASDVAARLFDAQMIIVQPAP